MENTSTIGKYEIVSEIRTESDRDSIKVLYKARDLGLNRLAMLRETRFLDGCKDCTAREIRKRYLREAQVTERLSHKGVVSVFGVVEEGDTVSLAMEWLKGESLEQHCTRGSLLPLHQLLHIVAEIADILDSIHAEGVVHRNLKPANIIVLEDGTIKITGFGIARVNTDPKHEVGKILGTPNYMSPEQAMGLQADARSDIFSLGVIFFQLLTGEIPFRGRGIKGLLNEIARKQNPSVSVLDRRIPPVVEKIVDKALAKHPGKRYQTARELAEDIRLAKKRV